jgi:hypothetical protein
MQQRRPSENRFGVLSIAVAACVACCVGPILALLGGLSLAGLASTVVIGSAGVVIALVAGIALVAVRRRRTTCTDDAAPTRQATIAANMSEQNP